MIDTMLHSLDLIHEVTTRIVLPVQQPAWPNTHDVNYDGVWVQECITCRKEGGDCEHTMEAA
jgi:hypothetical protein